MFLFQAPAWCGFGCLSIRQYSFSGVSPAACRVIVCFFVLFDYNELLFIKILLLEHLIDLTFSLNIFDFIDCRHFNAHLLSACLTQACNVARKISMPCGGDLTATKHTTKWAFYRKIIVFCQDAGPVFMVQLASDHTAHVSLISKNIFILQMQSIYVLCTVEIQKN